MRRLEASLFDRWIAKVEITDGCWFWRGAIKDTGYGVIQRGRRNQGHIRAHVFAYQHFIGSIPPGVDVAHSCHIRHCVNPGHLRLATRGENMRDMTTAGRQGLHDHRGHRNPHARLNDEAIARIRADSRTLREIAADHGVSIGCISAVRTRKTWAHVA